MTLDEWKAFYQRKTGEPYGEEPGFVTYYLPDRGFCQYAVNTRTRRLAIFHCAGDGKFWRDLGKIMLLQHGLVAIETLVCRNPFVYCRAMGFKVAQTEGLPNSRCNIIAVDALGNKLTGDYGWVNPITGKDIYIFVYHYREGEQHGR